MSPVTFLIVLVKIVLIKLVLFLIENSRLELWNVLSKALLILKLFNGFQSTGQLRK